MKPSLLFHVQHFLGIGHLVRAFALAEAMTAEFRVTLVTGGHLPEGIARPPAVEIVRLPSLGFDIDRTLVSREPGLDVESALIERRSRLLAVHEGMLPDVILVELFPFGRKKLAGELVPLLELARSRSNRPLVATSVRDILVTGRHDQQRHDDRAADVANRLIDLVLVHGDERFATLDESFHPALPCAVPIHYTGFVAPLTPSSDVADKAAAGTVVVSAGGGSVGYELLTAAIAAAPAVARRHQAKMTIVAGPLVGGDAWELLNQQAAKHKSVRMIRSLPALLPTLRNALVSVSQAGYNTAIDLLRAGIPSVLVPYGDSSENEQPRRAQRLAHHGLAEVVSASNVSGETLANAITSSLVRPRRQVSWQLDGARRSASILRATLATHERLVP